MVIWINNRYRVIRQLGRGGMGEVFLAEDTHTSNSRVAIKVYSLNPGLLDVRYFEREFMLLAALSHPHINGVADYGHIQEKNQFFFSAPYVEGVTLDRFGHSASFEEMLTVTAQVLNALDYLHIKGILHFDVKPDNILVAKDAKTGAPVAKLLDMGISIFEKDKNKREGFGTPNYMAPELIENREFDHRADLFSFGASLYKMIYQRPAFPGIDCETIYGKILAGDLAYPETDKVPETFLKIIRKLLNKYPEERFYSCGDILDHLAELYPDVIQARQKEASEQLTRSVSLIGRTGVVQAILDGPVAYATGVGEDGHPRSCVSVIGDAGVGKSRLLKEIRTISQTRKANTLFLNGSDQSDVFAVVEQMHKALGPDKLAIRSPWKRSSGGQGEDHSTLTLLKDELFSYVGQLLQNSHEKSLLVLIDNFDEMTDLVKGLMSHLVGLSAFLREEFGFRLAVVTAAEFEFIMDGEPIRLEPFADENVIAEYVSQALLPSLAPAAIPEWLIKDVASVSRGNPLLIEKRLLALLKSRAIQVEKGFVTYAPANAESGPLSGEIRDAYVKEFQTLPSAARRVLECIACFQGPFPFIHLIGLFEVPRTEAFAGIAYLRDRRFIRIDPVTRNLSAENKAISDVAIEIFDLPKRAAVHQKIFEYVKSDGSAGDCSEAAYQALKAETFGDAFALYSKLGQMCREKLLLRRAIEAFETALSITDDSSGESQLDLKVEIMRSLVSCYWMLGERAKALQLLRRLRALPTESLREKGETLLLLAEVLKDQGALEEAEQTLEAFRQECAGSADGQGLYLRFVNLVATLMMMREGRYDEVIVLLETSLSYFDERFQECTLDTDRLRRIEIDRLNVYRQLGYACDEKRAVERALVYYTKARAIAERLSSHTLDYCRLLSRVGNLYRRQKCYEKAEETYAAALGLAERCVITQALVILHLNLGHLYKDWSRIEKAFEHFQMAQRYAKSLGLKSQTAHVSLNFGYLNLRMGLFQAAGELLHKAYEIASELGNQPLQLTAALHLIDYFRETRQGDEAMKWIRIFLDHPAKHHAQRELFGVWIEMLSVGLDMANVDVANEALLRVLEQWDKVSAVGDRAEALYLAGRYAIACEGDRVKGADSIKKALEIILKSEATGLYEKELIIKCSKTLEHLTKETQFDESEHYRVLGESMLSQLLDLIPTQYREPYLKNVVSRLTEAIGSSRQVDALSLITPAKLSG